MHADYYQNTLYPLQDKVLKIVEILPVEFYLTGGTALSRAYLHHRYSDDLDFFVNGAIDFKSQVNIVIKALTKAGLNIGTTVADEGFARIFVFEDDSSLKLDFVNDVPFRNGTPGVTPLFERTDNLHNILSNKVTTLGRYASKDVVDIVWVNPVNVVEVLEQFPVEKMQEIDWINEAPSNEWFNARINQIIPDILYGGDNSLYK
jgi:Nucleotidyl transferase AbiEii toxin, Type IV TA system